MFYILSECLNASRWINKKDAQKTIWAVSSLIEETIFFSKRIIVCQNILLREQSWQSESGIPPPPPPKKNKPIF